MNLSPWPVANNAFLANFANWKVASTREISIKILEIDFICQAINRKFNVKAISEQVDMIVDITKQK